jgi:hypothetical protein
MCGKTPAKPMAADVSMGEVGNSRSCSLIRPFRRFGGLI